MTRSRPAIAGGELCSLSKPVRRPSEVTGGRAASQGSDVSAVPWLSLVLSGLPSPAWRSDLIGFDRLHSSSAEFSPGGEAS